MTTLRITTAAALALSYSTMAGADAPAGRYSAFGSTVLDRKTGLTWERTANSGSVSVQGATNYCGGKLDDNGKIWRVPTIKELLTIVDVRQVGSGSGYAALDSTAFTRIDGSQPFVAAFWTSTPHEGQYYFVDFGLGAISLTAPSVPYQVRCVH